MYSLDTRADTVAELTIGLAAACRRPMIIEDSKDITEAELANICWHVPADPPEGALRAVSLYDGIVILFARMTTKSKIVGEADLAMTHIVKWHRTIISWRRSTRLAVTSATSLGLRGSSRFRAQEHMS